MRVCRCPTRAVGREGFEVTVPREIKLINIRSGQGPRGPDWLPQPCHLDRVVPAIAIDEGTASPSANQKAGLSVVCGPSHDLVMFFTLPDCCFHAVSSQKQIWRFSVLAFGFLGNRQSATSIGDIICANVRFILRDLTVLPSMFAHLKVAGYSKGNIVHGCRLRLRQTSSGRNYYPFSTVSCFCHIPQS